MMIGYVLIGSEIPSSSPLLKPAKLVVSVMDQKDNSSISRDIENENLIYTLRQSPVLTTGFGHEYQYSPNNPPVDLGELFKNFRLIAHNGVLWIWSLAGRRRVHPPLDDLPAGAAPWRSGATVRRRAPSNEARRLAALAAVVDLRHPDLGRPGIQ